MKEKGGKVCCHTGNNRKKNEDPVNRQAGIVTGMSRDYSPLFSLKHTVSHYHVESQPIAQGEMKWSGKVNRAEERI
jgi:hypothetical protein